MGFPGCEVLEHFLTRVNLAIWDFHQCEETGVQNAWLEDDPKADQVLRYDQFSAERKEALSADLLRASEVLKVCGVWLPTISPE